MTIGINDESMRLEEIHINNQAGAFASIASNIGQCANCECIVASFFPLVLLLSISTVLCVEISDNKRVVSVRWFLYIYLHPPILSPSILPFSLSFNFVSYSSHLHMVQCVSHLFVYTIPNNIGITIFSIRLWTCISTEY